MMLLSRRFKSICIALLSLLLVFTQSLGAEQATVSVTSSVTFSVTNISASTTGSPTATVTFSSASLNSGNKLQIRVRTAASNFTKSWGTAIAANKVTWTTSGASDGGGSSGTLSSSSYTTAFLSNQNPSSGSITLHFSLAAPGSGTEAGTDTLQLTWEFLSVSGGG